MPKMRMEISSEFAYQKRNIVKGIFGHMCSRNEIILIILVYIGCIPGRAREMKLRSNGGRTAAW